MKAFRFLLVLPFLAVGVRAAPVASELALPEKIFPQLQAILNTAVQQSPRMLNRALDLEIAENNRLQARSNILPSFGGYASYYEARDTRADLTGRQNVTKVAYNFSISQPVYHWGERRNYVRAGEIQQKISQGQYREGYRLLAQELRGAYLRLIVQKLAVKRTRYYVEYTQNQLKLQEERLVQKVISEAQLVMTRLTAEQAQLALDRAEFDFQNAKASFVRLSGVAQLTDDAIPDSLPETSHDAAPYERLLAGFLAQKEPPTTEAIVLRHQLELEKLNYANQKTRLRPKLSAVIGSSQDEQSYTLNVAQKYRVNSLYAGFSVSWTIFDGFAASAAARTSLARKRQLENDYRQLTERLAQDAQSQVKQAGFAARNMSIYDRFLFNGRGAFEAVQQEFKRGEKSEADVSLAQLNVYDAQLNAYNARVDYLLKNGDFLGTLMEDPVLANVAADRK